VLTSTGAKTAQPKPYRSINPSIRLLAAELNRRFRGDLPQLEEGLLAAGARLVTGD
jgi:hypothetical protein